MFVRALKCLFVTALLAALVTGCRYRDPSIDLLESELRWMEDQVYLLEDELTTRCAELAACRQCDIPADAPAASQPPGNRYQRQPSIDLPPLTAPPERLPQYSEPAIPAYREPATDGSAIDIVPQDPSIDLPPTTSPGPSSAPPSTRPSNGGQLPDYQPTEPRIDLPTPADPRAPANTGPNAPANDSDYQIVEPSIEIPPAGAAPMPSERAPLDSPPARLPQLDSPGNGPAAGGGSGPSIQLQSFFTDAPPSKIAVAEEYGEAANAATNDDAIDAHVTHIVAQAEITTAYDFDGAPTAPGLLVIVEPRNSVGRYVALSGKVSVVVLDGAQAGGAARIGRWDFDASETRRRMRSSSHGRGVHLNLPWKDAPPESNQLHLFVRYTTVEGRLLEDDMLLTQGRSAERWSATTRRKKTSRHKSIWSASTAKRGVMMDTSPITIPVANPDQIELRPIPTAMADADPLQPPAASLPASSSATLQRPEWKPYR